MTHNEKQPKPEDNPLEKVKQNFPEKDRDLFSSEDKQTEIARAGEEFDALQIETKKLETFYTEKKAGEDKNEDNEEEVRKIKQEKKDSVIKKAWNDISYEEKRRYLNKDGEPDIEEYSEKLSKNQEYIKRKLKGVGIDFDDDAFFEMIALGYEPMDMRIGIDDDSDVQMRTTGYGITATGLSLPVASQFIGGNEFLGGLIILGSLVTGIVVGFSHGLYRKFYGTIKLSKSIVDEGGREVKYSEKYSKEDIKDIIDKIKKKTEQDISYRLKQIQQNK